MSNYATFLRLGAMDWERSLVEAVSQPEACLEDFLRRRYACVFCARSFWMEDLKDVFLQGDQCFMQNPDAVWELTGVARYHGRWPLIPLEARSDARFMWCSGLKADVQSDHLSILRHIVVLFAVLFAVVISHLLLYCLLSYRLSLLVVTWEICAFALDMLWIFF